VERHIFPDGLSLVHYAVTKSIGLVQNLVVFPERMKENLERATFGTWAAQRVRNKLEEAGVDHNDAYVYVQKVSFEAIIRRESMDRLLRNDLYQIQKNDSAGRTAVDILGHEELEACFDVHTYLQRGVAALFGEEETA
jgi:adenylosuccinate lyase